MLKKINAVSAILLSIFVLLHIVFMSLLLLGVVEFLPVFGIIGKLLLTVFVTHIIISLCIVFLYSGNGIKYPKLNKSTVVQRLSSIILLVLIHFHMRDYFSDNVFVQPSWFGYISEMIFTVLLMCHFIPSIDKGLLSLGINSKTVSMIMKIIFILAFALSLVSVSVYFLGAIL